MTPLLRAALLLSLTSPVFSCGSQVAGRSPDGGGKTDDPGSSDAGDGDEDPTVADHIALDPDSGFLGIGETLELQARLVSADGDLVPMQGEPEWDTSDAEVAIVEVGTVTAMAPGSADITVAVDGFVASIEVVVVDYEACCAAGGEVDNFCNIAPSTDACPMTAPGGYCDPNGDGSYDELSDDDWEFGYVQYAAHCDGDDGGECTIAQKLSAAAEPCADIYQEGTRHWRCVQLTDDLAVQVSQVCQTAPGDATPRWRTFNILPGDCCGCDGLEQPAGDIPAACVCGAGPACL